MRIFVYGSLKKNKKLHFYLKNERFLGYALTLDTYPMVLSKSGWYPYLMDIKEGYRIVGEVYEISYNKLKILDRLEEVPFYYKRKPVFVKIHNKTMKVYCYFYSKKKKYLKKELLKCF